jgi:hypothetical protein
MKVVFGHFISFWPTKVDFISFNISESISSLLCTDIILQADDTTDIISIRGNWFYAAKDAWKRRHVKTNGGMKEKKNHIAEYYCLLIYLLEVYLTTLSETNTIRHRISGWYVNILIRNWCGRNVSWLIWRYPEYAQRLSEIINIHKSVKPVHRFRFQMAAARIKVRNITAWAELLDSWCHATPLYKNIMT